MPDCRAILRQVESLGYVVKEFRVNGVIEFHAVKIPEGEPNHVARCNDGDGEEETYRAAVLLARACGIDVEDG
jgi:hypothetical protein